VPIIGGKDADALLSLLHLASELVPRIEASNVGRLGHLPCDLKDVAERVAVKPAHGGEVGGKAFAVPRLKLFNQQLHVGGNDFFGGLRFGVEGKVVTLSVVLLVMVGFSVLNGFAVFALKHALALAHASRGGKCRLCEKVPCKGVPEARRKRIPGAARSFFHQLARARDGVHQQVWFPNRAVRANLLLGRCGVSPQRGVAEEWAGASCRPILETGGDFPPKL
jgi:hypothetical protein